MCDPRVQGQDAMVVNREFFARRRRPGESAPETTEQRAKRLSDAAAARDAERKRASDDRALQDWADGEISKLGGDDLACLQKLAAERLEGGLVTTNHEAFVRGQMRLIMIERRHASNA
jgi:hypothetical protein